MSRRATIDRINSKYRGSAIHSPEPIGVIGAPIGGVTAVRRSTIAPSVVYGGRQSTGFTSGYQVAGQTVVSGLPAAGQVVTSGFPVLANQTVRRSRVDLYPSITPSVVAPTTQIVAPPTQYVTTTTRVSKILFSKLQNNQQLFKTSNL